MISINPEVSARIFKEGIFLYNRKEDELYEIDGELLYVLEGIGKDAENSDKIASEVLRFLFEERILLKSTEPSAQLRIIRQPETEGPSLRYLHVILTSRCNFSCIHCYVEQNSDEVDFEKLKKAIIEFENAGGLRILFSGGEPLLYSRFEELNEFLGQIKSVRRILLTNGWLLSNYSDEDVSSLNFDEIQLSLDGTRAVHDRIRRKGSFDAVIKAAEKIKKAGIDLSFATVINSFNAEDFNSLHLLIQEMKPFRWTVDFICANHEDLRERLVPPFEKAVLMRYSINSDVYPSSREFACGANLASLLPDGKLVKCDYFPEINGGNAFDKGLLKAWNDLKKIGLDELAGCLSCADLSECRGGCRYRALIYNGSIGACDPVACVLFGHREGG
jgi:radical SAM protein with 4Fe4S-binding SPASM domain